MVTLPRSLSAEISVMISAAMEYFTAEILELTGNYIYSHFFLTFLVTTSIGKRDLNLNALHIRQAVPKDDEIAGVLKGYACPHENEEQRYASQNWKSKLNELVE
jgi:hypothetical protein